jgi:hypothetical protein
VTESGHPTAQVARELVPSPGRPPVAGRDERRRFWAAIAAGMESEDAAVKAGVSQPVGRRWFRKAGGMSQVLDRPKREVIVIHHAPVAQLDRASGFEPAGRRFNSCRAHQYLRQLTRNAHL